MYIPFIRRRYPTIICLSVFCLISFIFIHLIKFDHDVDEEHIRSLVLLAENKSFCSERSARRGFNQHVLSVSAYESDDNSRLKTSLTWSYIKDFVIQAKKFYPTWIVRVYYYNLINKTKDDIKNLEKLHDNLDFCDVEHLPVLGNVRHKLPGKVQRFLAAIDPLVGVAMVRDLDSEIFEREVHAVNEWLLTTIYAFHIMRDHEQHGIEILGGLWGIASNRLSIKDRLQIASALIPSDNPEDVEQFLKTYSRAGDQLFLTHHIWPLARYNSLAHDSFTCFWSRYFYRGDTRAFPTKRPHPTCFVGCPKPCCVYDVNSSQDLSSYKKCPSMCRPKDHKDWLFC